MTKMRFIHDQNKEMIKENADAFLTYKLHPTFSSTNLEANLRLCVVIVA